MANQAAAKLGKALGGLKKSGVKAKPVTAPAVGAQFKDQELPPSDAKTLTPKYLLSHQNHFDPNTYTPSGITRARNGVAARTTLTTS